MYSCLIWFLVDTRLSVPFLFSPLLRYPGSRVQRTFNSIMGQQLWGFIWKGLTSNEQFSTAFSNFFLVITGDGVGQMCRVGCKHGVDRSVYSALELEEVEWESPCYLFPTLLPELSPCCHQSCCGLLHIDVSM